MSNEATGAFLEGAKVRLVSGDRISIFADVVNVFDVSTNGRYFYSPTLPLRREINNTISKFGITGRIYIL